MLGGKIVNLTSDCQSVMRPFKAKEGLICQVCILLEKISYNPTQTFL